MTARERLDAFFNSSPVYAKKALGQNFLISDYAIGMMIQKLKQLNTANIIEIGPGPGALTDLLLPLNKNYTSIELDNEFASYWKQKGIHVLNKDALQIDWKKEFSSSDTTLISNLPYQISSSIVIERSIDEVQIPYMILMFQKEVAQKIRSKSKTSEFSLLSVMAQTFWDIETLCDLGPRDFIPAPKIASRVLVFKAKPSVILNKKNYLHFCKLAFKQKRKMLKSNLMQDSKVKELDLLSILKELNLNETVRAEELAPQDFIQLYHRLGFL